MTSTQEHGHQTGDLSLSKVIQGDGNKHFSSSMSKGSTAAQPCVEPTPTLRFIVAGLARKGAGD